MSERGSFVTEYIYCEHCFNAAKKVLLGREKRLCSTTIPSWEQGEVELPIIAGKIGTTQPGEEVEIVGDLVEELEKKICHPVRIAVFSDDQAPKPPTFFVAVPVNHPEHKNNPYHSRNYYDPDKD